MGSIIKYILHKWTDNVKKNDINITKQKIQEKQEKRLNAGWEDVRIETRTFVRKIYGD